MKKFLTLFMLIVSVITISGCKAKPQDQVKQILENAKKSEMQEYKLYTEKSAEFKEISVKDMNTLFESKSFSGVVYMGYSGCPYCQRVVQSLDYASKEAGQPVYYLNLDKEVEEKDANLLIKNLDEVLEKDSNGNPEFYVPFVIGLKDSVITKVHNGVLEGFTIKSEEDVLDKQQIEELKSIYVKLFESVR